MLKAVFASFVLLLVGASSQQGCVTAGQQIVMGPNFKDLEHPISETATIKRSQCAWVIFPWGGGLISGQEGLVVAGDASAHGAMKQLVRAWRNGTERIDSSGKTGAEGDDPDADWRRKYMYGSPAASGRSTSADRNPIISPENGWRMAYLTLENRVESYLLLGRVCRMAIGNFVRVPPSNNKPQHTVPGSPRLDPPSRPTPPSRPQPRPAGPALPAPSR